MPRPGQICGYLSSLGGNYTAWRGQSSKLGGTTDVLLPFIKSSKTGRAKQLIRQPCLVVYLLTCICVDIHPGRVQPASPIAVTTSRTEALQARRSYASSLDVFTQSFLHCAWPKTRAPEIGFSSALIVVAHVFSWPAARLRGLGRRRSLISSPSGRLSA